MEEENLKEIKRRHSIMCGITILCCIIIILLIIIEILKPEPDLYSLFQNIALSILCSLVASFIFLCMQRGLEQDKNGIIIGKLNDIDGKLKT